MSVVGHMSRHVSRHVCAVWAGELSSEELVSKVKQLVTEQDIKAHIRSCTRRTLHAVRTHVRTHTAGERGGEGDQVQLIATTIRKW